jgi:hypothetical protein
MASCKHVAFERVPHLYVDGRPLYSCLACGARFVFEDDQPSYKGLAVLGPRR